MTLSRDGYYLGGTPPVTWECIILSDVFWIVAGRQRAQRRVASLLVEARGCLATKVLGAKMDIACFVVTRMVITHDVAKGTMMCGWPI